MIIYVYKWMCRQGMISLWGVDSEGVTTSIDLLQEDFILLDGDEDTVVSLPGIIQLNNTPFIDEYGSGVRYDHLYYLQTNSEVSIDKLQDIGQHPERYHYKKAFLTHLDLIHKYFMLKQIPYYSGWFNTDPTLTPLIDKKEIPPFTVLFYDIECVAWVENQFPNELNAQDYISSISFIQCRIHRDQPDMIKSVVLIVSSRTDSFSTSEVDVIHCISEKELLIRAISLFRDPSIHFLCGFNSARFDDKYLLGRYFYYGLERSLYKGTYPFKDDSLCTLAYTPQQLHLDVHFFYKEFHRYPSYSLDYLARTILNDSKKPMDHKKMRRLFLNIHSIDPSDVQTLIDYNLHDSFITMKLFCEAKLLDFTLTISAKCYLNIERVILAGKSELLSGYLLIESYRHGYLMNIKKRVYDQPVIKSTYQGAIVFLKQPGIFHNISVLDFASLYPSVLTAKNLSPSTCTEHAYPPITEADQKTYFHVKLADHRYGWSLKKSEQIGAFPFLCQGLLDARANVKTQLKKRSQLDPITIRYLTYLQLALKIINNSIYGLFGSPYSLFSYKLVAESVTAHARETLLLARDYFESIQVNCIFMDTDSVFIHTETEERGRQLTLDVNAFIGIQQLVMEFECFFHTLFLYSKKKYYGRIGSKTKASGFELKKKDFPPHCKSILQIILDLVLEDPLALFMRMNELTHALFQFDLCFQYHLFCKDITFKALYKYNKECHAPHIQFLRRMGEKAVIVQGHLVNLLLAPLPIHVKMGHALGMVDENNCIIGQPRGIPVNLVHNVKGACNLFDKIYAIVFKDKHQRSYQVKDHFKHVQKTLTHYNLVVFELKCVFNSVEIIFSQRISMVVPAISSSPQQPKKLFPLGQLKKKNRKRKQTDLYGKQQSITQYLKIVCP